MRIDPDQLLRGWAIWLLILAFLLVDIIRWLVLVVLKQHFSYVDLEIIAS
jgi:hypothetical protein